MITIEAAAWLLLPIVASFFVLSRFVYPIISLNETLLLSIPLAYTISGWLLYIVSCALGGLTRETIQLCLAVYVLIIVSLSPSVFMIYNARKPLWKGLHRFR
jgi:hypothetical protein